MKTHVFHLTADAAVHMRPSPGNGPALPVAEHPLVVPPGTRVRWQESAYALDREGLYAFVGDGVVRNLIVFQRDYLAFCSALAQIHVKGMRHVPMSVEQRIDVMRTGRLAVMCGGIVSVALRLLEQLGERARRVVGAPSSGHVMLEILQRDGGGWMLADIHNHFVPTAGGMPLSLDGMLDRLAPEGAVNLLRLGRLGTVDCFGWGCASDREFGLGSELVIFDDDLALDMFRRGDNRWGIFDHDGLAYFADEDPTMVSRIRARDERFRCLRPTEWKHRFYG